MRGSLLVILPLFVFWPLFADAQASNAPGGNADNAALMQRMRELEDRVIALEGQVRLLKSQAAPAAAPSGQPAATSEAGAQSAAAAQQQPVAPTPAPTSAIATPASGPQPSLGGAGASAAKVLNPDISMIGDFIGAAGHDPVYPIPALQMHESELGVQAIIDPYARGDFFLTFGEEGVGLGGGIYHVNSAAWELRGACGQNAVGVRESEYDAQSRAAVGGSTPGDQ